jgi:hypothetical protein
MRIPKKDEQKTQQVRKGGLYKRYDVGAVNNLTNKQFVALYGPIIKYREIWDSKHKIVGYGYQKTADGKWIESADMPEWWCDRDRIDNQDFKDFVQLKSLSNITPKVSFKIPSRNAGAVCHTHI